MASMALGVAAPTVSRGTWPSARAVPRPGSVLCRSSRALDGSASTHMPLSEGLHLSLFHPYRALPPEGATLHPEEEACDPQERACKTPAHTYEARCGACSNTGWARGAGSASSGRRGNLHTCVVCHGLGYVRRTTARFCPDSPAHMTLARGGGGSPTFELPRLPTRGGTPEPRLQAAS